MTSGRSSRWGQITLRDNNHHQIEIAPLLWHPPGMGAKQINLLRAKFRYQTRYNLLQQRPLDGFGEIEHLNYRLDCYRIILPSSFSLGSLHLLSYYPRNGVISRLRIVCHSNSHRLWFHIHLIKMFKRHISIRQPQRCSGQLEKPQITFCDSCFPI